MIVVVCFRCNVGFRVKGEGVSILLGPESDLWPEGFTCPSCSKTARGYLEDELSEATYKLLHLRDLTPTEGFAVLVGGVGLPEERECTKEVIQDLLGRCNVKMVGKDVPNTSRVNVDYLEIPDGTRMYFGSSGHGAIVYRVTKERSRSAGG